MTYSPLRSHLDEFGTGPALAGTRRAHIELDWTSESTLKIVIAEADFSWEVTPKGHAFVVNPQQIWLIPKSSARLGDQHLGPPGPLGQQAHLGDSWIPQRGVFVIGRAFFSDS